MTFKIGEAFLVYRKSANVVVGGGYEGQMMWKLFG